MEIIRGKKEAEHFSDLKEGDIFSFVKDYGEWLSSKDVFMVSDGHHAAINLRTGTLIDDDLFDIEDEIISYPNAKLYLNN